MAMYDINQQQQEQDTMMEQYDESNGAGYEEEFVDQGYDNIIVEHGGQDTIGAGKYLISIRRQDKQAGAELYQAQQSLC